MTRGIMMKSYMRKEKGKIAADVDSIGFFDFARGIGIIGVLMGHSILLWYPMTFTDRPFGNLNSVIGSSIMAMFFMISGYGFQRRKMYLSFSEGHEHPGLLQGRAEHLMGRVPPSDQPSRGPCRSVPQAVAYEKPAA